MRFDGDDYESASVKFKLETGDSRTNIEESVGIPVKMIFDMTYLIGMCVRRIAAQYENEVIEMENRIEQKKHPFKDIGGNKDGKKN
jgi:CRISPR/Cas system CMR subunit Cmr6 (Cas7 group RAMP superfamily)